MLLIITVYQIICQLRAIHTKDDNYSDNYNYTVLIIVVILWPQL